MTYQQVCIAQLEASLIVNLTSIDCINGVVSLNSKIATYFLVEYILSIPVGHMYYIDLYSKNICFRNDKASSPDIWYASSSSGPQPSLFKLCPWSLKWPCPSVTCVWLI